MEKPLIKIVDAYKRYGSMPPVLNGFNMCVNKGAIYGLLGASGCGKTTILNCIVSRLHLDAGSITLGVKRNSDIGYMPQDMALFPEFTIEEILQFYGKVHGMTSALIKKRGHELCTMVNLPSQNRFIHTLSGGQQRRVSLIITLLHDPPLLILDEPTVGMDPLLCHKIWEYLVDISVKQLKTILITTHYIDEAKQSTVIGLIREGILLSEESPRQLMERTSSGSLEDAFLELSKKQNDFLTSEKNNIDYSYPTTELNSAPLPLVNKEWFRFSRFSAQLDKHVKATTRSLGFLAFILLLPAFQTVIFCNTFGQDPERIPVGIVSDEIKGIFDRCNDPLNNYTHNALLDCNVPKAFSCEYIRQVRTRLVVKIYGDLDEAKMAVKRNDVWGVLHISSNFTDSVSERLYDSLNTEDISLDNSVMNVWMDMSNYVIANIIKRDLIKSLFDFLKVIVASCGTNNTKVADLPIRFEDPIFGRHDPIFAHSSIAATLCSYIFYFAMVFTSGSVMMDKNSGLMDRVFVAGMTRMEIIAAQLVVQFVIINLQTTFMLVVSYGVYSNPFEGFWLTAFCLLYLVAIVGIAFGYFLGELFDEERLVAYAGIGTVLSMFLLNGSVWPVEGSHYLLRSWSYAFPIVAAVYSYNDVTNRGYDLSYKDVYMGIVSCVAWIVIFSLLTAYVTRRRK